MYFTLYTFSGAELRHDRVVGADDLEGADGGDRVRVPHRRRPLGVSADYRDNFPLFPQMINLIKQS